MTPYYIDPWHPIILIRDTLLYWSVTLYYTDPWHPIILIRDTLLYWSVTPYYIDQMQTNSLLESLWSTICALFLYTKLLTSLVLVDLPVLEGDFSYIIRISSVSLCLLEAQRLPANRLKNNQPLSQFSANQWWLSLLIPNTLDHGHMYIIKWFPLSIYIKANITWVWRWPSQTWTWSTLFECIIIGKLLYIFPPHILYCLLHVPRAWSVQWNINASLRNRKYAL